MAKEKDIGFDQPWMTKDGARKQAMHESAFEELLKAGWKVEGDEPKTKEPKTKE